MTCVHRTAICMIIIVSLSCISSSSSLSSSSCSFCQPQVNGIQRIEETDPERIEAYCFEIDAAIFLPSDSIGKSFSNIRISRRSRLGQPKHEMSVLIATDAVCVVVAVVDSSMISKPIRVIMILGVKMIIHVLPFTPACDELVTCQ